jgi:hypothetical protein
MNGNNLAADKRRDETERMNRLLKLYLKYYNKKLDNVAMHEILDKLFSDIKVMLSPDEDPDEDLYEYVKDLTVYVDNHIDRPTNESRGKLLEFARVKKIINEYSTKILQARRNKKKSRKTAQTLKNMNNNDDDDEMGDLISGMKSTRIRGGTRKVRKH